MANALPNPTAVGSNDKVTLGRGVACAIPMPPSAQPKTPMAAKEAGDGSKVKLISLAVAGAMLAILLIVGIVALFSSSPAKNDPDSASMSPTDLSSKTEDSRKKEENSLSENAVAKPAPLIRKVRCGQLSSNRAMVRRGSCLARRSPFSKTNLLHSHRWWMLRKPLSRNSRNSS